MSVIDKLELLKENYAAEGELDRVLGKLLQLVLDQRRLHLERYEQELQDFERRFGMDSGSFHQRFEAGELGDSMDFFEWSTLYELRQDLLTKIARLESAT